MQPAIAVYRILNQCTPFSFDIRFSPADPDLSLNTTPSISPTVIGLADDQPHYRLLVAKDKCTNRLLLVQFLTRLGFEVRETLYLNQSRFTVLHCKAVIALP
ncbi:MAG TPA: hypothetical protein V6C88_18040 [Chroococcidiopsis sp.]